METLYEHCAGLDVHKGTVVVCVRHVHPGPGQEEEVVETFGTTTRELLRLSDWLAAQQVTHAAMESTGVYWKPIWNLLEDRFKLLLVNAAHIKQVPGRKTDVKDCQWIAQLLQHGLLRASFVPDRPQRELRDLTRQRTQLTADKARVSNRLQKVLEDANIKLAGVVSDILGSSARQMLRGLIDGRMDAAALANLAHRKMRAKIPQLTEAMEGRMRDHHRFLLRQLLDQAEYLERQVEAFDQQIEKVLGPFEQEAIQRLDLIPGIDIRSAQNLVAEIGTKMEQFPTSGHLSSWAGMCPGNNESAGKHRSGKTRLANRWLKQTLTQCAWGATRKKSSYLSAQYHHLAGRRGRKRALLAVGHSILVIGYHLLSGLHADPPLQPQYQDLGANYFDQLRPESLKRRLVRRLEKLGYKVELSPAA